MNDSESLNQLIQDYVQKALYKFCKSNKLLQRKIAKVAEVNTENNTASVYLRPDDTTKSVFYPNNSGVTLNVNDWVYLYVDFANVDQGEIVRKK